MVGTTYAGLPGDVRPGDRLLIDDGKVALECVRVDGPRVVTKVVEGGRVSNNKGINLPGVAVSVPALSEKDKEDLRWALHLQADLIALSFVRSAADVNDVRAIMDEEGVRLPMLAKIEKPQAVDNLAEIVEAFDGIMVARGDLGVELPLEDVPLVQTRAIALARRAAKPVIVATQMLESMIETSRPTRAEASDVANAVLDGTDALMLSGETSVGKFPIVAVETMARIIVKMEENALDSIPPLERAAAHQGRRHHPGRRRGRRAARRALPGGVHPERRLGPAAGPAAVADPAAGVHAGAGGAQPARAGVGRRDVPHAATSSTPTRWSARSTRRCSTPAGWPRGDLVVIVAGSPPGIPGSTNAMRVHRIGDATAQVAEGYAE